jgi:hypothetical protein
MNMKDRTQAFRIGAAAVLIVAVVGFIVWRLSVPPFHPGADAIGVDPSDSQALTLACDKVVAIARADMQDPLMGPGARIFLFRMGDASTANDPVLMDTFELPEAPSINGGPEAGTDKQRELETRIRVRCSQIPVTTVSPLFEGAKRMVEFVQQEDPHSTHLKVHFITDGEETEFKAMVAAFNQNPGSPVELPATIDNARVEVQMCGTGETIGTIPTSKGKTMTKTPARDPIHAERQKEVWTKAFAHRADVNPYCIRANAQQVAEK